jgi:hypothetical protein
MDKFMNHRLRFVAPGVSTLVLLLSCGDYSNSDPNAPVTLPAVTPTATTPATTTPSTPPTTTPPATATTTAPATTPPAETTAPGETTPPAETTPPTETAAPTTTAPPTDVVASCENVEPCGGDVVGTWSVVASCLPVSGETDMMGFGLGCSSAPTTGDLQVTGTWTFDAEGASSDMTVTTGDQEISLPASCLDVSGTITTCDRIGSPLQALGFASVTCTGNAEEGCACPATVNQMGGAAYIALSPLRNADYTIADNVLTVTNRRVTSLYSYCVEGTTMTLSVAGVNKTGPVSGTIVLQKQ